MNTQTIYRLEYVHDYESHTEEEGIFLRSLDAQLAIPEGYEKEREDDFRNIDKDFYIIKKYNLAGNKFVLVDEQRYLEPDPAHGDGGKDPDQEQKDYDLWNRW